MRILHYIPTYAPAWSFGGPVRSVSSLCEGLSRRGHTVTVFTTDAGLESDRDIIRGAAIDRNGVEVRYFRRTAGWGIKSPEMENAVKNYVSKYDLIHVTAVWQRTGPAACRAARKGGVPYVISPRGALGPYSWARGRIKKRLYYAIFERSNLLNASGFHYTSKMEMAECQTFKFGKPHSIIPNSLNLQGWSRDNTARSYWRKILGCDQNSLLCLYAGRLHHKKGLEILPGILARIQNIPWRMAIVGNDSDGSGKRLAQDFASQKLGARVNFLPAVKPAQLPGLYSAADVFLMPSHHENFGNVAIEAAVCGCYVLASVETAVAEQLEQLGAGTRLPRVTQVWSDAIGQRMTDCPVSIECVNRVKNSFSDEYVAERMEYFYNSVVC